MNKYNFRNLQACDYALVSANDPLAVGQKIILGGLKNAFNMNFAVHVAFVVFTLGTYFLVEMMKEGIRIKPITEYTTPKGFWDSRIIQVRRNPVYSDEVVRTVANNRAITDANNSKYKYDNEGLLQYLFPKWINDPNLSKGRMYCSELVQHYAELDGEAINLDHKPVGVGSDLADNIDPHDIQLASNLVDIKIYD